MRLVKQFFFFGNDLQVLEVLNGTQTVQRAHCALLSDTVALKMRLVKKYFLTMIWKCWKC